MSLVRVAVHPSQFPCAIQHDLLHSIRSGQINHKFHYDSFKQTQKWLALHDALSPSRTDPRCRAIYADAGFEATKLLNRQQPIHLISLGCGGGQKDAQLIETLQIENRPIIYSPVDVSTAMVLTAIQTVSTRLPLAACFPLVCDLAATHNLAEALAVTAGPARQRLVLFFGMIQNFEPGIILPQLQSLLSPGDFMLFSANLAPGADYEAGLEEILPQYDNPLTKDWLIQFLLDLGVEPADGTIHFEIEDVSSAHQLKRVTAWFAFHKARAIRIDHDIVEFQPEARLRLFFSYRYTTQRIATLLAQSELDILNRWITPSEEEGVFLCRPLPR